VTEERVHGPLFLFPADGWAGIAHVLMSSASPGIGGGMERVGIRLMRIDLHTSLFTHSGYSETSRLSRA
jgi:hypothetical protein